MPTLSEITEMASALVLQAPGTDAPLDVLGDWGREVARFLVSFMVLQTLSLVNYSSFPRLGSTPRNARCYSRSRLSLNSTQPSKSRWMRACITLGDLGVASGFLLLLRLGKQKCKL